MIWETVKSWFVSTGAKPTQEDVNVLLAQFQCDFGEQSGFFESFWPPFGELLKSCFYDDTLLDHAGLDSDKHAQSFSYQLLSNVQILYLAQWLEQKGHAAKLAAAMNKHCKELSYHHECEERFLPDASAFAHRHIALIRKHLQRSIAPLYDTYAEKFELSGVFKREEESSAKATVSKASGRLIEDILLIVSEYSDKRDDAGFGH